MTARIVHEHVEAPGRRHDVPDRCRPGCGISDIQFDDGAPLRLRCGQRLGIPSPASDPEPDPGGGIGSEHVAGDGEPETAIASGNENHAHPGRVNGDPVRSRSVNFGLAERVDRCGFCTTDGG